MGAPKPNRVRICTRLGKVAHGHENKNGRSAAFGVVLNGLGWGASGRLVLVVCIPLKREKDGPCFINPTMALYQKSPEGALPERMLNVVGKVLNGPPTAVLSNFEQNCVAFLAFGLEGSGS